MRAPTPLEPIDQPRLLLVEGADDDRFFTALLRSNDRRGVQIMSFHGLGRLPTFLATLPASDGFPQLQWLGIIVDATASSPPSGPPPHDRVTAFDRLAAAAGRREAVRAGLNQLVKRAAAVRPGRAIRHAW